MLPSPPETNSTPAPTVSPVELLCPPSLNGSQLQRLSPAALAYLGDAVYELYFRSSLLWPPKRLNNYHQQVVALVRAETQAQQLNLIIPYLTHTELDIVRRGRNATTGGPKRLALEIYQQATSLETLVGYLYLSNLSRLSELFSYLQREIHTQPPLPSQDV